MIRPCTRAIGLSKLAVAGIVAVALSTTAAEAGNIFTINPAAATPGALAGTSFNADTILLSDFTTITLAGNGTCGGGCSTFSEQGFLNVSQFQNGAASNVSTSLNVANGYGMYFQLSASGVQSLIPDSGGNLDAYFTSASFTLFGYNTGASNTTANYNVTPTGTTQTATLSGLVALATGSLVTGSGATNSQGVPSANLEVSFVPSAGESGVFPSPALFYPYLSAAFTNTAGEVTQFGTLGQPNSGFEITNGGGTAQFNTPEPASLGILALALGGLGLIRRRRGADA